MNNKDVQVAATEIFNACSRVCPSSPLLSSSDDKKHTLLIFFCCIEVYEANWLSPFGLQGSYLV